MFRDFDEFSRRPYGRQPQTIEIPRRNGGNRRPRDLHEALLLSQQEVKQAQSAATYWQREASAWQDRAEKMETVGQQQMKRAVHQLENQLTAAQKKIAELEAAQAQTAVPAAEDDAWQEKYTRLYAEVQNNKQRLEKRYAAAAEQEKEKILRDMLALADNLERALDHAVGTEDETGIALTLRSFTAMLKQHGVQPIMAQGHIFDPEQHEAVSVVVNPNFQAGTVFAVEEKGYFLNGKLLRPARVIVVAE